MEILPHAVFLIRLRATSHVLGWPGWPGYRDQLRFGFLEEISARFPRWEKAKDPWKGFWREIREAKQTWRNTKAITFEPIIASATLTAVSLQLNGMLMMCTIQQAMRDDAIRAARSHSLCSCVHMAKCPAFFPISRLEKKPSSQEPSKPTLSYEHNENFTKDSEVKRDFGNLARSVNQAHVKRP